MSTVTKSGWKVGEYEPGSAARLAREVEQDAERFHWTDLIGSGELIYPDNARAAVVSLEEAVSRCGRNVVLFARVSSKKQRRKTLDNQKAALEAAAHEAGLRIVGRVAEVGTASRIDGRVCVARNVSHTNRPRLRRAIALARQRGAFLLCHNSTRLMRHPAFGPTINSELQPYGEHWVLLAEVSDGVTLATIVDPEATNAEIQAAESVRGQSTTNRRGGRPPKPVRRPCKEIRDQHLERALYLATRKGLSSSQIAAVVPVPQPTVKRWIRKAM